MISSRTLPLLIVLLLANIIAFVNANARAVYLEHALNATDILNQQWYNRSTGLWQNYWWNSGVALATIGDVGLIDNAFKSTATSMFSHILVAARATNGGTFLNTFYDDEGWWAMGWIKAYDVTNDPKYLAAAKEIFQDMLTGQKATCGGIWWSKDRAYNAAISNQLFLNVAASLANRVGGNSRYRDIAFKQASWLLSSGMINDNNTFNDGLDVSNCKVTGPVFSYNQGVVLGALVEMHKMAGQDIIPAGLGRHSPSHAHNKKYLDIASDIALGAIKQLATPNDGILTDIGYPDSMDTDRAQFKGIFARNLMYLQAASPRQEFVTFLQRNADSIWKVDRQEDGQLGALWQGPVKSLSAPAQISALDCLIAAAAVSPADQGNCQGMGCGGSATTVTTVLTLTRMEGKPTTSLEFI